jgi:hypothetical protein
MAICNGHSEVAATLLLNPLVNPGRQDNMGRTAGGPITILSQFEALDARRCRLFGVWRLGLSEMWPVSNVWGVAVRIVWRVASQHCLGASTRSVMCWDASTR